MLADADFPANPPFSRNTPPTPQQLNDTYGVLGGYTPDLLRAVKRLQIGAVIAHVPAAIGRLEEVGFRAEFSAAGGPTYLVRLPKPRA